MKQINTAKEAIKILTSTSIANAAGVSRRAIDMAMYRNKHLPPKHINTVRAAFPDYYISDQVFGILPNPAKENNDTTGIRAI